MSPNGREMRELLLARMRQQKDFPAMSQTIALLNKLKSSDDGSPSELSNIILRDYALTLKILKLVNSVGYLQFGEVTTISRAIMLLGFENIRNIALSLLLFEQFSGSSSAKVKELLLRAICSGVVAQKVADETKIVNVEEAFICALFHSFGRIITAFYMPDKIEEVRKVSFEKGLSEDSAAMSVLGSSYEMIGMEIANFFSFPKKISLTMKKVRPSEISRGAGETDRLCSIANFSNEITGILSAASDNKGKDDLLRRLLLVYRPHFAGVEEKMDQIISAAASELSGYAGMFGFDLSGLPFYRKLAKWGGVEQEQPEIAPIEETEGISTIEGILESDKSTASDTVFSKGVLEINTAILNDYPLNDIIRIALETIYRGMNFAGSSKVLFLFRDAKVPVMKTKFGFGADMADLRQWFEFTLGKPEDIFNIAMAKPTDLVIKDIISPDIKPLLPSWYSRKISEHEFIILLPIVINKRAIGLFYVEGNKSDFSKITSEELKYLTILRDQTVLAIKQKHSL